MDIAVGPMLGAPEFAAEWGCDAVISAVSPSTKCVPFPVTRHAVLRFRDGEILSFRQKSFMPKHAEHFFSIIGKWQPDRLLIHCVAGLSRSTALCGLVCLAEDGDLETMRNIYPQAQPNRLVLAVGAKCLGLDPRAVVEEARSIFHYTVRGPYGAVGQMPTHMVIDRKTAKMP